MKPLPFLTLLSLLLFSSCRDIRDPELRGFDNVEVKSSGLFESVVRVNVRYYNPNSFNAKLKEAHGQAWVNNIYLGTFQVDSLIKVSALSEFIVPVDLTFATMKMIQFVVNDEVNIKVVGTAKAGKGGFYRNFSLNYEGKQDIKKYFKPGPASN